MQSVGVRELKSRLSEYLETSPGRSTPDDHRSRPRDSDSRACGPGADARLGACDGGEGSSEVVRAESRSALKVRVPAGERRHRRWSSRIAGDRVSRYQQPREALRGRARCWRRAAGSRRGRRGGDFRSGVRRGAGRIRTPPAGTSDDRCREQGRPPPARRRLAPLRRDSARRRPGEVCRTSGCRAWDTAAATPCTWRRSKTCSRNRTTRTSSSRAPTIVWCGRRARCSDAVAMTPVIASRATCSGDAFRRANHQPRHRRAGFHAQFGVGDLRLQSRRASNRST